MRKLAVVVLVLCFIICGVVSGYQLREHPRMFVNKSRLAGLAARAEGGLSKEYAIIKGIADEAVADGVKKLENHLRSPYDLVCLGICYLVERELGNEARPYAEAVVKAWGDGDILNLEGEGSFGYYGLVYDWVYDALTAEQRKRYGDKLGEWLRFYTGVSEITLNSGGWWYNQTWQPAHLNTRNSRDSIAGKLFVALAISGAGTVHEADAKRMLDSWAKRVPAECIPAFDEMGGVWAESMGHGGYGPIKVIPWSFEAWRTATGEDYFKLGSQTTGYMPETTRWAVHLTVPCTDTTAWIDDNRGGKLTRFAEAAPILGARYCDGLANAISDQDMAERWNEVPWVRFLCYEPAVKATTPREAGYDTAQHFKGAGHVYMRSEWGDANATWAFFGAGPKFAGHSRDDEGHFLIAKKGWLVTRIGGGGGNDRHYYGGGSLAFNLMTIFDANEDFRRYAPQKDWLEGGGTKNERDGGLIRYVYSSNTRNDRAQIKAYHHDETLTYAAADLTRGYYAAKADEVTRQFLYLRGEREFFVIFDRVGATSGGYPKTWFLHMPGEPKINGRESVIEPGHVFGYDGDTATWVSCSTGDQDLLSTGSSRAFLKTLLPKDAKITKRGGEGHEFWGHPYEPTAQYNHVGRRSGGPPVVPWRLEVEAPRGSKKDYFLHVLEVGEEGDKAMSQVNLIESDGFVGARIRAAGREIEVEFSTGWSLLAKVKIGDGPMRILD